MYDAFCRFLAENFSTDFAIWLTGKSQQFTKIEPTELSNEPIRADSIIFLQSEEVILHLEFQTAPDEDIPFRIADYYMRLYRRYRPKKIEQIVIYLKPSNSELVFLDRFTTSKITHNFDVIRLWEEPLFDLEQLPGLLPLAVLTNTPNKTETLARVSSLIDKLEDRTTQSNLATVTYVLADLVLVPQIIQQYINEKTMQESATYQLIAQKERLKGKIEGRIEGELNIVLKQLNRKLGTLPTSVTNSLSQLNTTQLETLSEDLLNFQSLEDLTNWLDNH